MYKLMKSADVCGRKAPCVAGYPEDMQPDLCLYNTNFPSNFTPINSHVLICALFNSPEILKEFGYKIVSAKEKPTDASHVIPPEPEAIPQETETPAATDVPAEEPSRREYTDDEKLVLTAARKAFVREHKCDNKYARAYVSEHAEEILESARARGEL